MPLLTMMSSFGPRYASGDTAPTNTVLPAITGTALVGNVLTCGTGTWTGKEVITYAYQWYKDSLEISGETANTYTIIFADIDSIISCTVTATNSIAAVNASATGITVNPSIPVGAIIMYNGANPAISGWSRYAAADDLYIKGTATQGEIATTAAASVGSWSFSMSISTTGAHTATSGYNFTQGASAGGITAIASNPQGDHSHSLSYSSSSTAARPYSTGVTLLKASTDQTTFPTNTIHINDSNLGVSWTQKVASTDFRYIKGDASTPTDYANVSLQVSATSGSSGTHAHLLSGQRNSGSPPGQLFNPGSTTGQAHTHPGVSNNIRLNRINGKINKMWIAASADKAYSNTIVMFDGTLSSLPSYWKVCDGTAGTVNMSTFFLGYSNSSNTAHDTTTTDTATVASSTTSSSWTHTHATTATTGSSVPAGTTGHQSASYSHTHTVTGTATVSAYEPGSIKLAFIQLMKLYYMGTQKAIFGYGDSSVNGYMASFNLVSSTGVVATDTGYVGTPRSGLAAAGYGTDKAIFGYGYAVVASTNAYVSMTNKVSNLGVVSTDTTGVGTARRNLAAAGYGTDKAIFAYGENASVLSMSNLVSNAGVVSADVTGVGTARRTLAAAGYGGDKAIFGYGYDTNIRSMTNLVSNTGVIGNDVTGVGTARLYLAAAGYGGDKAIFGYGFGNSGALSITSLVSNTGVVASDTAGVGTARYLLAAAGYGIDKAIFGYGYTGSQVSITNKVSNTGVVATDTAGVGTVRDSLAAAGYSRS